MSVVKTTQRGKFYHGTSGYPIRIRLGVPLTSAESITVTLKRPNNLANVVHDVPLGNIFDPNAGVFDFIPADGDLSVSGVYTITIRIVSTGDKILQTATEFGVA
jgi:hypothetical protein